MAEIAILYVCFNDFSILSSRFVASQKEIIFLDDMLHILFSIRAHILCLMLFTQHDFSGNIRRRGKQIGKHINGYRIDKYLVLVWSFRHIPKPKPPYTTILVIFLFFYFDYCIAFFLLSIFYHKYARMEKRGQLYAMLLDTYMEIPCSLFVFCDCPAVSYKSLSYSFSSIRFFFHSFVFLFSFYDCAERTVTPLNGNRNLWNGMVDLLWCCIKFLSFIHFVLMKKSKQSVSKW